MSATLEEVKNESSQELAERVDRLRTLLNATLQGKADVIEYVLVCLLARGHLLLEDQPGLGKTTLAKALAAGLGEQFARVQCTPDLLPSDVTGFNLFNQKSQEFEFREGPVFADVLLADEINRATPRTQSALLEAMAERQVTLDTKRYPLSETFFVIATQNPVEQHGTYPLPEAQLDRFAMKLSIGYAAAEDEVAMLDRGILREGSQQRAESEAVFGPGELSELQRRVAAIHVGRNIQEYLVAFGQMTRGHAWVHLGISPRGLLVWQRCSQARAFLQGRTFVIPEDAQQTAGPVLSVRLGIDDLQPEQVIEEMLTEIPVPVQPSK
ncbi:MAG: AAA family ATPase [Rubinisphaera brasiliensis]|uniref:AAA family ATPase n=1 Tax=Rubinisphaera brasiliensis TaxID=119 RepID=UPI00391A7C34